MQLVGTVLTAIVQLGTAWWMLTSIKDICVNDPSNIWTCPSDRVFYDASVIWGLIGPRRIFGNLGLYKAVNWAFLLGLLAPIPVKLLTMVWPKKKWLLLINMPVLIGATAAMPPATSVNYVSYILMGFIFNYVIFKYRKAWWSRHNYLLSAGLDSGLAFAGVGLYFCLQYWNIVGPSWWGGYNNDNQCPLATCPTQKGRGSLRPDCPPT
jgi:OPT family oligopeptide transporter